MDKKSIIIVILSLILVAVVSGGAVYLWQENNDNNESESTASSQIDTEQENENDTTTSEAQPVQEPQVTNEQAITEAMAAKYSKTTSETDLSINMIDENHASGVVIFEGEVAGGWWLAAKQNGNWIIVADGNGTVMCSDIDAYNFPTDMVPECWDETTETLITR